MLKILILGMFLPLVAMETNHYGNLMRALPQLLQQSPRNEKYYLPNDVDMWKLYAKVLNGPGSNGAGQNISTGCINDLNITLQAARGRQMWAFEFLDATGKFPSGFLMGNIFWMGSFDQCLNITATVFMGENGTLPTHPFTGQYCRVGIPIGPTQDAGAELGEPAIPAGELQVGLCIPSTCSQDDVLTLVNSALALVPLGNTSLQANVAVCHRDLELDTRAIVSITILSMLGVMIVIGTLYDIFVIHRFHATSEVEETDDGETTPLVLGSNNSNNGSMNIRHRGYRSIPGENDREKEMDEKHVQVEDETGFVGKVFQAFSLYTNGSKLLSTKTQAGTLGAVNGIRFISMSWVILGHSYAFLALNAKNIYPFILEHLKTISFMAVLNATVAVDTFFLMSGLLVGYLTLKELKKRGGVMNLNWAMFYFHRFWRLTPAYGLVMLLYIPLVKYVSNGPFWQQDGIEIDYCGNNFWMNILYVNNLWHSKDTCMLWSWYMANDMQFYLISPLLLIPLFLSGIFGGLVCFGVLIASFTVTGVLTTQYNLPMNIFGTGADMSKTSDFFDMIYTKPYCRIGPYVVGIIYGYILYRTECKRRINRMQSLIGWALAAVCCLSSLYGNFDTVRGKHIPSTEEAGLFNAINPSVWSLGVGWVIYACATGCGGIINSFLSWKLFIPLSRLTYMSYLIHPVIMEVFYNSKRDALYVTDLDVVYYFLAHLVLANAAAFVLSLVFESPSMGLEKAVFRREKKH